MSMTLATAWVRRGVSAEFPQKYEIDEAELGRIEKLANLQLSNARQDLNAAQDGSEANEDSEDDEDEDAGVSLGEKAPSKSAGSKSNASGKPEEDDNMKEYNLSDYDEDGADDVAVEKFSMFGNVRSLAYHQPGEEDPYLVLPEGADDSENEREDLQILPTDNLILAAKVEDEVPHLEVFVYEDDEDNIYVHHDIMLPSIPLCLEWVDFPVGKESGVKQNGNYVAVGMMSPEVEIWNLDIVEGMYPAAILGQQPEEDAQDSSIVDAASKADKKSKKKPKKKKKKPKPNDSHHVDAVLALALNKHHRNLLASGSADTTLKLWDLNTGTCAKSYSMHTGKITALDWNPLQPHSTVLLSGSADTHEIYATDMRAPDAIAAKWTVEADVERLRWDPHNPRCFYVTTEAGTVHYFDSQSPPTSQSGSATGLSKPVWTLQAHDSAVSAFDVNAFVPGFLATGSEDKKVKLWNVEDGKPSMVVSRNLEVGRVFSTQFAPDQEVAFRLSVAGSKGQLQVWDTSTNATVRRVFAKKAQLSQEEVKEKVVGVGGEGDDDDESEDDEGEDQGAGQDGWESMEEG